VPVFRNLKKEIRAMKTIGIIVLVVGLILSIYSGINYVTKEDVVKIGGVEVTAEKEHEANWSPFLGPGVIALGAVILIAGGKRSS
jgi:hypothetical protein